ncbi:MOSC domain-containing protein, partial [Rhodococcoides yunnanense]|uniref:MOSC domain-containing protein n=1 Tax=Rhodococcoides yunnanense TaxID=278209 RepID=UPI001114D64F
WDDPHTEDTIREFDVGDSVLTYTKLAIRCAVTTVDQRRGERDGPEPLRTLGTYRRARQKGVAFGVKLSVLQEGAVTVGDELHVRSWGDSEL